MPIDSEVYLMGEQLKLQTKLRPNHEFLVDWATGKGERRLSYKQVTEDVYRLCWALEELGVERGDMAATLSYNSIEQLEAILGGSFIGYVYGCQNPELPDDLLVTIINDRMAAKVLFFDDECRDKVKKLIPKLKSVQHYICFDGPSEERKILSYHELISKYEPKEVEVEVEPDGLACLYMSGGTTGIPKAAMWTHEANYWGALYGVDGYERGTEEVGCYPYAMFASTALQLSVWSTLLVGAKLILFRGKNLMETEALELFCEAVSKEKIKWGIIPAIWFLEIATWPEEKCKKYNLSSLVPVVWGINVPLSVWKTNWEKWGIIGPKVYGACEYSGGLHLSSTSMLNLLRQGKESVSSLGYPYGPMMVRLVDNEGNDVKPGEVGELIVKGPAMAHGYLGEPERWTEKYKEGWYFTGDMCRVDESGYFYIETKKEDIGMCPVDEDGKYVLPYSIQDVIVGMEDVVEASLIAVPDPEYKAKYKIIVRPKEGAELSADGVIEVASKVAPSYLIKDVIIRKEPIPKGPAGKILVRALAKEYGGIIPEE